MNRFFGIGIFALLAFTQTPDCTTMGLGVNTIPLKSSNDPGVQAAGDASSQAEADKKAEQAARDALTSDNLSKGDKIDFAKIDEAIKLSPGNVDLRLQKAAMARAAGQNGQAELSAGEAMQMIIATRGGGTGFSREEYAFTDLYMEQLNKAKDLAPPGAAKDRLTQSWCEQYFAKVDKMGPTELSLEVETPQTKACYDVAFGKKPAP